MRSLGIPTMTEKAEFRPCWTMSSGITFQPWRAVALALWAPSIWKIRAPVMTFLASPAST